jgi:hypothetical protein
MKTRKGIEGERLVFSLIWLRSLRPSRGAKPQGEQNEKTKYQKELNCIY